MANDRIHIKCQGCGAWKMLLKHMGAGLEARDNGVLEWLGRHGSACHPYAFATSLHGVIGFSLHTEDEMHDHGALRPDRQNAEPPTKTADG